MARRQGCSTASDRSWPFPRWRDRRRFPDLADELGVSREFVYAQSLRASTALTEAFWVAANDEEKVLFEGVVTPRRLEQLILWLVLMCRASHHAVREFLRDCHELVAKSYP